ncbi:MAG: hypothetical protein JWQ71_1856 [Pedosphaera sp.]|nr:hypothetical protein [Pedosphaera sp.]
MPSPVVKDDIHSPKKKAFLKVLEIELIPEPEPEPEKEVADEEPVITADETEPESETPSKPVVKEEETTVETEPTDEDPPTPEPEAEPEAEFDPAKDPGITKHTGKEALVAEFEAIKARTKFAATKKPYTEAVAVIDGLLEAEPVDKSAVTKAFEDLRKVVTTAAKGYKNKPWPATYLSAEKKALTETIDQLILENQEIGISTEIQKLGELKAGLPAAPKKEHNATSVKTHADALAKTRVGVEAQRQLLLTARESLLARKHAIPAKLKVVDPVGVSEKYKALLAEQRSAITVLLESLKKSNIDQAETKVIEFNTLLAKAQKETEDAAVVTALLLKLESSYTTIHTASRAPVKAELAKAWQTAKGLAAATGAEKDMTAARSALEKVEADLAKADEANKKDVEDAKRVATLLGTVEAKYNLVHPASIASVQGKIATAWAEAKTQAAITGDLRDPALAITMLEKLDTLLDEIKADNQGRKEAADLIKGNPAQKKLFDKLAGMTDPDGRDLSAGLYAQFGKTGFAKLLTAMDVLDDDVDKSKASENLRALGGAMSPAEIKGLCDTFGDEDKGAKNVGSIMKHGVKAGQLAELRTTYEDEDDLKAFQAAYAKGFKNDPELFANIVAVGLKAESEDDEPEDLSIQNLKKLTDAFEDPDDLGNLMTGFASKDKIKADKDKKKTTPKDKLEQASADKKKAGERMAALLETHFEGKPEKLKDPFMDKLNNLQTEHQARVDELDALDAKEKPFIDYGKLTPANQAKVKLKDKPKPLNASDKARQTQLAAIIAKSTPLPLGTAVRNAASFETKELEPADLVMPTADLRGLKCSAKEVEHFASRHTRAHFSFDDKSLAPANTPITSTQYKTTTLWPDGTDVNKVKLHLKAALLAITVPTYAAVKGLNPVTEDDFCQIDTRITVDGETIDVRLGFERVAPSTVKITQFYPKGSLLDSIPFEDMHGIKKGLAIP